MSLCAGEISQSARAYDWLLSEADYYDYLEQKTASLTWLCCRAGAMVARASAHVVEVLSEVGRNLGMAFQVVDDVLDLTAGPEDLGKPTGLDLREGTLTLPVIHLLRTPAGEPFRRRLCQGQAADDQTIAAILQPVRANGCVDYAYHVARRYVREVERLVASLGACDAGSALVQVMRYAVERRG
jgi:geranylgeranyl pyrophosphate synthase